SDKATKLAAKLLTNAVDTAIIKVGTALKFRDLDDALKLVDRSEIDVEQDEDDPSDVEIDTKTVEAALKALAKAKPHLLIPDGDGDEGSGEKSGSKFGGSRKSKDDLDEERLRELYPALRVSSPKK